VKRLLIVPAVLLITACVPPKPPDPPQPPLHQFQRTVGAMFTGLPTPVVKLSVDTGELTSCTFDKSQHTVCFLADDTPAPFGADLLMSFDGFDSIDFRFTLQDFTPENAHQELPEQHMTRAVTARPGAPRASGRVYVDDAGAFNPVGASLFWGLWGWKNDQARTRQNLACLAGLANAPAGCPTIKIADYVRVLASVQGRSWEDRETRADWPDYVAQLRSFITAAYNEYGLRTELTIYGGDDPNPQGVASKVAQALPGLEHMIMHIEAANELTLPDNDKVRQIVQTMKNAGMTLIAPYSPNGGEFPAVKDVVTATFATMGTSHPDRSLTCPDDCDWRQARKGWSEGNFLPFPTSLNEPVGPQSSVAENWSPLQLAMMRATAIISGTGAFVYHTGPGIRGGGAEDVRKGRNANFWELPHFAEIGIAIKKLGDLLPGDVANWQAYNSGWAGNPLSHDGFWVDGQDHGVVRMYSASNGPSIVAVLLGVKNFTRVKAESAADYELFDGRTAKLIETKHLNQGQTWQITGTPNADSGFLLIGRR